MNDTSITALQRILPEVRGTYRFNAALAPTNWFGVGGPAEVLYRPADLEDLVYFLQHKPSSLPYMVLGVGSNLLIRDGGVEGTVIKLGKGFTDIRIHEHHVHAQAGALNFNVVTLCKSLGLAGLEFLSGIPGTIGGGLAMNAGCYGKDMASCLVSAEAVDDHGIVHHLTPADFGFIYRGHTLPTGWVFTKAVLQTYPSTEEEVAATMAEIAAKREMSQPLRTKTSGSTFTNPTGHKAWELIDQAGCRGLHLGDAIMSEKHCNFMINLGNATASELEALGELVREKVFANSGIMLEWEIKRVGKTLSENH